jgi:hypothetical protein
MDYLELSTRSLFGFASTPESPVVEVPAGIRLAVESLAYDGKQLSLDVLASYQFEPQFAAAFQKLSDALVLGIEDASTGAALAVPLVDPRKRFPPRSGPNFQGIPPWSAGRIGLTGGSAVMPLDIVVPRPLLDGPSLYLTMFLQRHVSNTLAIDLTELSATSFLAGEPFDPGREGPPPDEDADDLDDDADAGIDDGADEPSQASGRPNSHPALTASLRGLGPFPKGAPILLDITLALTAEEIESLGPAEWLKSVFVWTSTQASQATGVHNLLDGRTVFPDDFRSAIVDGKPHFVAPLAVDLSTVAGLGASPGINYVYVSARHHRSEAVEVRSI